PAFHPHDATSGDRARAELPDRVVDPVERDSPADEPFQRQLPCLVQSYELRDIEVRTGSPSLGPGEDLVEVERQRVEARMSRALSRDADEHDTASGGRGLVRCLDHVGDTRGLDRDIETA